MSTTCNAIEAPAAWAGMRSWLVAAWQPSPCRKRTASSTARPREGERQIDLLIIYYLHLHTPVLSSSRPSTRTTQTPSLTAQAPRTGGQARRWRQGARRQGAPQQPACRQCAGRAGPCRVCYNSTLASSRLVCTTRTVGPSCHPLVGAASASASCLVSIARALATNLYHTGSIWRTSPRGRAQG